MTLRLRLLTDGRAGNRAQALGLAEALARALPCDIAEVTVRLPRLLDPLPQRLLALLPVPELPGPADLMIGAGRRGNLAAARGRAAGRGRAVAILDPQMRPSAFDAVLVPQHDGLVGANVIATLGSLNRITRATSAAAPADMLPDLPAPRLALLIGGPSRSARFGAAEIAGLLDDLAAFRGWSVLATPSRRTPAAAVAALRAARPDAWVWDGAGGNPYPGLLARADAVMVTGDSVNMVSEAASSGLPLHLTGTGAVAPKLRRFHDSLRARGLIAAAPGDPAPALPLAEADRVAALLIDRFGFS